MWTRCFDAFDAKSDREENRNRSVDRRERTKEIITITTMIIEPLFDTNAVEMLYNTAHADVITADAAKVVRTRGRLRSPLPVHDGGQCFFFSLRKPRESPLPPRVCHANVTRRCFPDGFSVHYRPGRPGTRLWARDIIRRSPPATTCVCTGAISFAILLHRACVIHCDAALSFRGRVVHPT